MNCAAFRFFARSMRGHFGTVAFVCMKIRENLINEVFSCGVPLLLFLCGLFFWLYLRQAPFKSIEKTKKGERKASFRALSVALAGTLGVGNIAGVSFAIIMGGAGSLFWMWVSAFFAMILKYAEITLACRYRTKEGYGGAMYYMRDGLGGLVGSVSGAVFAVLCLALALWMGGLLQAEAVISCVEEVIGGSPYIYGGCLAFLAALVIFGGVQSVSSAAVRLVPLMSVLYISMCLGVIFVHRDALIHVFERIFEGAFDVFSVGGGIGGFLLCGALRNGFSTGLLSNEAGCGTAPMAHVTSGTSVDPVRQGRMGMLEVAVDTLFICTLSGLAILCAVPTVPSKIGAIELILRTFTSVYGGNAGYFLAVAIFFFAYATIICWGYYGESCVRYLFRSKIPVFLFRMLYCVAVFCGGLFSAKTVFGLTDRLLGLMTVLNLFALLALSGEVKHGRTKRKKNSKS